MVFAWSAVAKLIRHGTWRGVLARYRLGRWGALVAVAVPPVELAVPALILGGATRAGAALALLLLVPFSLAVLRARALEGDRLPCGCFGKANTRDYRTVLARNAGLGVLSGVILLGGPDVSLAEGMTFPSTSELLPAALVATGLVTASLVAVGVMRALRKGQL